MMMKTDSAAVSFPLRINRPIIITRFGHNRQTASVKLSDCRIGSSGAEGERVNYFIGNPQVERMIAAFNMVSIPLSGWRESDWGQSSLTRMEDHGLLRDWLIRFDAKVALAGFEDDGFSDYATPRLAGAIVRHLVSVTDTRSEPTDAIGCIVLPDCVIAAVSKGFGWMSHMADPASASTDTKPGIFEQRRMMSSRELGSNLPALRRVEGGKFVMPRSQAILADVFLHPIAVEGGMVTACEVADTEVRDLFEHLSETKYFAIAEYVGEVGSGLEGDSGIWDSEGEPVWCLTILKFESKGREAAVARFDIEAAAKDRIMQPVSGEEIASAMKAMFSSMGIENYGELTSDEILFVDGQGRPIDPSAAAFCETHGFSQSPGIFAVVYDRVEAICERRGALLAVAFNNKSATPFDLSGIEVSNSENGGVESGSGGRVEEQADDERSDAEAGDGEPGPSEAQDTITPTEDDLHGDEMAAAIDGHMAELSNHLDGHGSEVAGRVLSMYPDLQADEATILVNANQMFWDAGGKQLTDDGRALVRAILKVEAETTVADVYDANLADAWRDNDGASIFAIHYLRAVQQHEVQGDAVDAGDGQPQGQTGAEEAGASSVAQDPAPEDIEHDDAEPAQSELTKDTMEFSGDQNSDPGVLLGGARMQEMVEQVVAQVGAGRAGEHADDIDVVQAVLRETDSFGHLNLWIAQQVISLRNTVGKKVSVNEEFVTKSRPYAYACILLGDDLTHNKLVKQSRIEEILREVDTSTPLSREQRAIAFQAAVHLMTGAWLGKGVFAGKKAKDSDDKFRAAIGKLDHLKAWNWQSGFDLGRIAIEEAVAHDELLAEGLEQAISRWWEQFRRQMLEDKPDRNAVASLVTQFAFRAYRDHFLKTAAPDDQNILAVVAAARTLDINEAIKIANLPADWWAMDRATLANALNNRTPSSDPSAVS